MLPDDERIVAIEDTLELRIERSNCVRFEARGLQQGAVTIRDLVRHALRHRPDHIVVGDVRGGEAADLLQALNTGHAGSLTTVHANNAESALSRIASCAMQGGGELPWEVTCRGVVDGIAMVIHMTRHRTTGSSSRSGGNTMTDEEKIIRVNTLEDFALELGRDGDETLEVPAWIAGQDGVFPEDVGSEEEDPGSPPGSLHQ